jgi:hypothetical protein
MAHVTGSLRSDGCSSRRGSSRPCEKRYALPMTSATTIALTAGGTLLAAGIVAVISYAFQRRREHAAWLRQQRVDAYAAYIRFADRATFFIRNQERGIANTAPRSELADLSDLAASISLLGPDYVVDALQDFTKQMAARQDNPGVELPYAKARAVTVGKMRRALEIDPPPWWRRQI